RGRSVAGGGKGLLRKRGGWACHSHKPYDTADVHPHDRNDVNPAYKPDRAATYDPSGFPESVRPYAKADFGPNLSNIAAKFQQHAQGQNWLAYRGPRPLPDHPTNPRPHPLPPPPAPPA